VVEAHSKALHKWKASVQGFGAKLKLKSLTEQSTTAHLQARCSVNVCKSLNESLIVGALQAIRILQERSMMLHVRVCMCVCVRL